MTTENILLPLQTGTNPLYGTRLPDLLSYRGEFGTEIVLFLPFCNWLSKMGFLETRCISTYRGMGCFYEGLKCVAIIERDDKRVFVPSHERPWWLPVKNEHNFDTYTRPAQHIYPDLRRRFSQLPLLPDMRTSERPVLIVHNKHNNEWSLGPVNHISLDSLEHIFKTLSSRYNIVYIRHGICTSDENFSDDQNTAMPFQDRELLERYPKVHVFDDLYAAHLHQGGKQDINTFKNVLYSHCYHFISSQGGGAHHIAMFSGSLLIVLHRGGQEENWAYQDGYYSFMAHVPPLRAICLNEDELARSLELFSEALVFDGRVLLPSSSGRVFAELSPQTVKMRRS